MPGEKKQGWQLSAAQSGQHSSGGHQKPAGVAGFKPARVEDSQDEGMDKGWAGGMFFKFF
jgi:hypothetical protein